MRVVAPAAERELEGTLLLAVGTLGATCGAVESGGAANGSDEIGRVGRVGIPIPRRRKPVTRRVLNENSNAVVCMCVCM